VCVADPEEAQAAALAMLAGLKRTLVAYADDQLQLDPQHLEDISKSPSVVKYIRGMCMDKDSTNSKIWRDDPLTCDIPIYYDPGHVVKNLLKNLIDVFKTSDRYTGLASRMKKRVMSLIKQSERAHPDNLPAMRFWFLQVVSISTSVFFLCFSCHHPSNIVIITAYHHPRSSLMFFRTTR
jgi:hypothetical protein